MPNELKSINDQLISDCKSIQSGNIPFPSSGSGWGAVQIFRDEQHWDNWISDQYGFSQVNNIERYRQLVGDLSHNSLMCAAIRFLGDSLPEAPLQVKEKKGAQSGSRGESKIVEDHSLPKLWNKPNDIYDGVVLLKGLAFSLVLSSNAYMLKRWNEVRSEPLELWWEPHWTIRPVWRTDGVDFISNYEVNRNGQWLPVPVEDIIHIRDGLHPYNQRLGFSGNDSILRELYGDSEAANYYASLMGGSGVPGFAVSIDKEKKMDQQKMDAFEKHIVRKTTGDKRGQPLIMHGAKPYKLGFNPREMDLRESRYMAEDRFCAEQGIPAVVLELGTGQAHSIYDNVDAAMERAWRSYICPKLTMIERTLNMQLLEDFDGEDSNRFCEHDLAQIPSLQEDQDKKALRLGGLYEQGGIMRSELRSGMGYGASDPGNEDADKVWGKVSATEQQVLDQEAAEKAAEEAKANFEAAGLVDEEDTTSSNGKQPPQLAAARGKPKKPLLALVKSLVEPVSQLIQPPLFLQEAEELEWQKFDSSSGSLGIPRSSMPQVRAGHRGAMVQFLKARGISHVREEVLPGSLKPSQAEFSPAKVEKARAYVGGQRALLVSSDDYVADGHHQWLSYFDRPTEKISIIRLNVKILELLLAMSQFPSSDTAKALLTALKGGDGSGNFGHEGRPGQQGGSSAGDGSLLDDDWGEGEVRTTKEIAKDHGISTASAYKQLLKLEQEGLIDRYGYRTKDGWESPGFSGLSTNSLGWQRGPTKAMPNGKQLVTPDDVTDAISFLKQHRFNSAAAMMTAQPLPKEKE